MLGVKNHIERARQRWGYNIKVRIWEIRFENNWIWANVISHKLLILAILNLPDLLGDLIKTVPLQAWSGPEGSRKLRFPDFLTTTQDGGRGCQPYAPAAFTPRIYTWYSFLLKAESTPWP
jgi:hypothetical protein